MAPVGVAIKVGHHSLAESEKRSRARSALSSLHVKSWPAAVIWGRAESGGAVIVALVDEFDGDGVGTRSILAAFGTEDIIAELAFEEDDAKRAMYVEVVSLSVRGENWGLVTDGVVDVEGVAVGSVTVGYVTVG